MRLKLTTPVRLQLQLRHHCAADLRLRLLHLLQFLLSELAQSAVWTKKLDGRYNRIASHLIVVYHQAFGIYKCRHYCLSEFFA